MLLKKDTTKAQNKICALSQETDQKILDFRDARDWKPFHNPKDLAISLSLEAAELLECFQWSADDLIVAEKRHAMAEELADVLIYGILFADVLGLNPDEIVRAKIERNAEKYPQDQARGSKAKYTELKGIARCK